MTRGKSPSITGFSVVLMGLIQGGANRGWLAPPPHQPMTKNSILIRLFFIVHTPDKVLVDLKIVTDDTIVEVYVPGAEGILFVFR